jgi:hypothetical protein
VNYSERAHEVYTLLYNQQYSYKVFFSFLQKDFEILHYKKETFKNVYMQNRINVIKASSDYLKAGMEYKNVPESLTM